MEPTEHQPLERRTLQVHFNGIFKDVPALHKNWISRDRQFCRYTRHPSPEEDGTFIMGARETWLELVNYLQQDLRWLLTLPHHKFWSQIIFSKEPHELLTSFLQEAPPYYQKHLFPNDPEMLEALNETERLVFLVFIRLSTEKESNSSYITTAKLGQLWYDNYLFTVPILFDICLLYGRDNKNLVGSMIRDVMNTQPNYFSDFQETIPYLLQVCDTIKESVIIEQCDELPAKLNQKKRLHSKDVRDLILHFFDTITTVEIFMDVYPEGCRLFCSGPFASKLAYFYAMILPEMFTLAKRNDCDESVGELVENSRVEILKVVRHVLTFLVAEAVENAKTKQENVDEYLSILCELLSESSFIADFHRIYPIDLDVGMLTQIYPEVDGMKIHFVLEALSSCMDLPAIKKEEKPVNHFINYPGPSETNAANAASASSVQVSGVELESLITQVKDILPHLGEGYIEVCLRHYDFSTERLIAAILESTLPPVLEELPWDTPRETLVKETGRLNVFDHDEFDVMTRDHVDTSRIHRGKRKSKHKNLNQLLEDKTELEDLRDRYAQLGIVEEDVYDDDYDDTYEALDSSVREDDDKERRPFVVPRVLRTKEESESEDDVEAEQDGRPPLSRDNFVQDPAELRARAEQRRQERGGRDVVGKPKGQGQDKQVVKNRNFKGQHKSFTANHNRRSGASRKRNQGMIPS